MNRYLAIIFGFFIFISFGTYADGTKKGTRFISLPTREDDSPPFPTFPMPAARRTLSVLKSKLSKVADDRKLKPTQKSERIKSIISKDLGAREFELILDFVKQKKEDERSLREFEFPLIEVLSYIATSPVWARPAFKWQTESVNGLLSILPYSLMWNNQTRALEALTTVYKSDFVQNELLASHSDFFSNSMNVLSAFIANANMEHFHREDPALVSSLALQYAVDALGAIGQSLIKVSMVGATPHISNFRDLLVKEITDELDRVRYSALPWGVVHRANESRGILRHLQCRSFVSDLSRD